VRIVISKLIFAAAVLGAALCFFNVPAGHAGYYGDARWCAVTDQGADVISWDCEYDSLEECRPSISSGGTHGYCGQNPYWRPEPTNSGAPTGSVGAPTGSSAAPTGSKVAR
jgi:hypothetical protein